MIITPVRWTKTGRVALLSEAGECAIPVYEAGGWCTLGPQGCLPWRWLIAHAHSTLGTVGSALLPKLGRRYSFSIHTLDFRREQRWSQVARPWGTGRI